jgi:hypothetical protein
MTNRVLLGRFPDGRYGLRVSQPGYDVMSNPVNDENLYFNSDWSTLFPIYQRGSFTCYGDSSFSYSADAFFPNLGYIPFLVASFSYDGNQFYDMGAIPQVPLNGGAINNYGNRPRVRIQAFSDRVRAYTDASNGQITINYVVLTTQAW